MLTLTVNTHQPTELVEITPLVQEALGSLNAREGVLHVAVPHTTAGVTLNENADPDVRRDMLADLERLVPSQQPYYRHYEKNSAAHLKASLMGFGVSLLVEDGRLVLGPWQGIYLCEFDGPRRRRIQLRCISS